MRDNQCCEAKMRKKRCKIKTIFGKMINQTPNFGIFMPKKLHFAHFICKFAAFLGYYTPFLEPWKPAVSDSEKTKTPEGLIIGI